MVIGEQQDKPKSCSLERSSCWLEHMPAGLPRLGWELRRTQPTTAVVVKFVLSQQSHTPNPTISGILDC